MAEAPIVQVVLFEDRASVTRRLDVPAGRHEIVISGMSPLVQSERLAILSPDVDLEEAHVERVRREPAELDPAPLRAAVHEAELGRYRAEQGRARCAERFERANTARRAATAWFPQLLEREDPEGWLGSVRELSEDVLEARRALATAEKLLADAEREAAQLQARLQAAQRGQSVYQADLKLRVHAATATSLSLRYTLPCALWRPAHRATLDDSTVHMDVGAMVWNATGEDWENVELVCSTARPGDASSVPPLEEDRIRLEKRGEVVVEAREVAVQTARETREVDAPGVDDGGEPRTFTAPAPVSVRSDGRPLRVALERWSSAATLSWRCTPLQKGAALLRSVQANGGLRPLLAGPVEVFRGGGRIGRTSVAFVPPGEPFPLWWGSHDGVRISRRQDRTTERTRITGHQTHRVKVGIRLSHLGDTPVDLEVVERVPVSELKEVKVGTPTTLPPCDSGPDRDGFLTWHLRLLPRERQSLELTYTIEAPGRVTLPD